MLMISDRRNRQILAQRQEDDRAEPLPQNRLLHKCPESVRQEPTAGDDAAARAAAALDLATTC